MVRNNPLQVLDIRPPEARLESQDAICLLRRNNIVFHITAVNEQCVNDANM
jgi:hypothetical protein